VAVEESEGTISTERRPVGYWVKEVDRLLEASLDAVVEGHGLTRRHWQVLNVIEQGGTTVAEVDARLAPFLTDTDPTMSGHVADLLTQGIATDQDGTLALTANGRELFDTLLADISRFRQQAVAGISHEDYVLAVSTLEHITRNLA
jgi:DNA-binding MarR family transcriptional regulator